MKSKTAIVALSLFFILCIFGWLVALFQYRSFVMPSASMFPTMVPGDHFYADIRTYKSHPPSRGDIVVYIFEGVYYVKRVVGIPGDHLALKGRDLFINDQAVKRNSVSSSSEHIPFPEVTGEGPKDPHLVDETLDGKNHLVLEYGPSPRTSDQDLTLKDDEFFVLGDNRDNSNDSRMFGPLHRADIFGKALFIWMSFDAASFKVKWSRTGLGLN